MEYTFTKNKLTLHTNPNLIEFEIIDKYGVIKFSQITGKSPLEFDTLISFLQIAENYCSDNKVSILVIADSIISTKDMSFIKKNNYTVLWDLIEDEEIKKTFPKNYIYGTWAKEVIIGTSKTKSELMEKIKKSLKEINKDFPTFEYYFAYENIQFSYRGSENEYIRFYIKNNEIMVIHPRKQKEYIAKNIKEIKNAIIDILNDIESKTKIKNLFKPTKKYYTRFVNTYLPEKNDINNELYTFFKKHYTSEEIEDYFAKKQNKINILNYKLPDKKRQLLLLEILDYFVLLDETKKHYQLDFFTTKEKSIKTFEEKTEFYLKKYIDVCKGKLKTKTKKF